ncbi:MAG: hypothetical protein WCJ96_05770 [Verrucomicrobiota bacterium]|jgi:hypothetical protein
MNRELQKLLREKWFLVAADLIAVIAILCVMPDKRDGFDTFLAITAILAASLIVVIPVLKDGGGKAERLAEQARLRAQLAEEIDRQRESVRAGADALNRRIVEVELSSQKAAEAAATAVAQRASTEINALKATVAELEKKLHQVAAAAKSNEAVEEISSKVDALATTLRGVVADVDEATVAANAGREEAARVLESEWKTVREEVKKSAKQSAKEFDKLEEAITSVREEVRQIRENPSVASAPSVPSATAPETEAEVDAPAGTSLRGEALDDDEEEVIAEIQEEEAEEAAAVEAPAAAPSTDGAGTSLIINLMIGIGNKPYVRGTGPGLSQDKGVLMNFLGIGRWQWVSPNPEAPATIEVWKNDQTPMGEPLHLSGGEPVEVDEGHFSA